MDRDELYAQMARRKSSPEHSRPYDGGNGRIDRFLKFVREGVVPMGEYVIDVGGSHGDLLDTALREGLFKRGFVVDISEESVIKASRRGLSAIRRDIDKDGLTYFRDKTADIVVALDFIEHIVDPQWFVEESFRVLRPGGVLFLNTPNIQFWQHLQSQVCDGRFPHTSGDAEVYHGGHLAFYNMNDMLHMLGEVGFVDVEQLPSENRVPPPPVWMQLLQHGDAKQKMDRLSDPDLLVIARKP